MIETRKLSNGVRIIVKRMEGLYSVAMGVLVGTGSAFETDAEDGISHFIEHMQFKGTPTRTAFEISDAFDALGAQVNAFTGKDMTCYYAKATCDHAAEAFDLLADLFLHANYPEHEMVREKGVILEEIGMNEDSPEDLCLDLLARATFGKHNYGRNILGPAANVKNFTREQVFHYKKERYVPRNIVVSFAGNIDPEEAFRLTEAAFGGLEDTPLVRRAKRVQFRAGNIVKRKKYEQVHFAIGFPSIPRDDDSYYAVQVMNAALGGGLSSRLFKRVREELGLAYSVYSYTSHYAETGLLAVYAGVNPEKAEDAKQAIVGVIEELRRGGITEEEFLRGREQLKAGSVFSQESTNAQMLLYGRNLLYTGEVYDLEKRMEELSQLTLDDVTKAIGAHFDLTKAAIAAVGTLADKLTL